MRETDKDWEALVGRVRAGDSSAAAEIVSIFQARVHCMILARTRRPETARTLTREALLQAVHALRTDDPPRGATLPAFLHGIVKQLLDGHGDDQRAVGEPPPQDGEDARREVVLHAVANLDDSDREILLMSLVEGIGTAAIAARLGLTADVVRQRKARALERVHDEVLSSPAPKEPQP